MVDRAGDIDLIKIWQRYDDRSKYEDVLLEDVNVDN